MNFKEKLRLTIRCHEEMKLIIHTCEKFDSNWADPWEIFWDAFWESSKNLPFKIDWHNPRGTYEGVIRARFKAVDEFVEQLEG